MIVYKTFVYYHRGLHTIDDQGDILMGYCSSDSDGDVEPESQPTPQASQYKVVLYRTKSLIIIKHTSSYERCDKRERHFLIQPGNFAIFQ